MSTANAIATFGGPAVASADITKLAEALRSAAKNAEITTNQVMVESANFLVTEMEIRVPVDTGELRESIGVQVQPGRVVVGPTAAHATYVEYGTKPHIIEPKNKKALAFKVNGKTVIVKRVQHPGTKAQPFVRPAFDAWVETLGPAVADAHVKYLMREVA
jgi:HK97 gp10 family phage protein